MAAFHPLPPFALSLSLSLPTFYPCVQPPLPPPNLHSYTFFCVFSFIYLSSPLLSLSRFPLSPSLYLSFSLFLPPLPSYLLRSPVYSFLSSNPPAIRQASESRWSRYGSFLLLFSARAWRELPVIEFFCIGPRR